MFSLGMHRVDGKTSAEFRLQWQKCFAAINVLIVPETIAYQLIAWRPELLGDKRVFHFQLIS